MKQNFNFIIFFMLFFVNINHLFGICSFHSQKKNERSHVNIKL